MNILAEIAEKTKERVARGKACAPLAAVRRAAEEAAETRTPRVFEDALRGQDISFICEVKRAAPSNGLIAENFPYLSIALEYEAAGAAAISCLTEPYWFQGRDGYLRDIALEAHIPVLRKDFTVDEYMIYEASALGASAVLLIVSILDCVQLRDYITLAHELNLSALVEAHDEAEAECALGSGARIIGVNNRDLKTFKVDMGVSVRLRPLIPREIVFVAESGVNERADIENLRRCGADAALVGEKLMRASDKRAMLDELRGTAQ